MAKNIQNVGERRWAVSALGIAAITPQPTIPEGGGEE